jgi:hypothetical protein
VRGLRGGRPEEDAEEDGMRVCYNTVCDESVALACPSCGADIPPGAEFDVAEDGAILCLECSSPGPR